MVQLKWHWDYETQMTFHHFDLSPMVVCAKRSGSTTILLRNHSLHRWSTATSFRDIFRFRRGRKMYVSDALVVFHTQKAVPDRIFILAMLKENTWFDITNNV